MNPIRVLVVDDSLTVRKHIVEVLSAEADIRVVGEAEDGKSAIDQCLALGPDLVTLDMMLPVMSGLAATEYIMAHRPTPILIVSSSLNRGEAFKTCDALSAGALDVLEKPDPARDGERWNRELVSRIRLLSRIRVITHPRGRIRRPAAEPADPFPAVTPSGRPPSVVAIGASTGGPGALLEVLGSLGSGFEVPILLVLHIAEAFGPSFAAWLGSQVPLPVSLAADGAEPRPGVQMAPPGRHLAIEGSRLRLTRDPERHACRPSVDVLFESVAREHGPASVACLLTGMGRDGAAGLLAIRRSGGRTIAQDEESSVVFGMPGEAVRLGAAEQVLPLDRIGPAIARLAGRSAGRPASR